MTRDSVVRLDEYDRTELEDAARCLDKNYTPEKFESDWRRFTKLKTYIRTRRERAARKAKLN